MQLTDKAPTKESTIEGYGTKAKKVSKRGNLTSQTGTPRTKQDLHDIQNIQHALNILRMANTRNMFTNPTEHAK